jgi:hypothetical protein
MGKILNISKVKKGFTRRKKKREIHNLRGKYS